jgi:hypothetical protein
MLAELRAVGVGIVIVDQLPSAVAPEVIKSTSTKISFRQVAREDREEIGATMLFGEKESEEIARLPVGEAFFYTEGYYRPRRIKTENIYKRLNLNTSVFGTKIIPHICDDPWFQEGLTERTIAELVQLKKRMDLFNDERRRINQAIAALLVQRPWIMGQPKTRTHKRAEEKLIEKANNLAQRLADVFESFLKNPYAKYFDPDSVKAAKEPIVLEFWEHLIHHVETIIRPNVKQSLEILKRFSRSCQHFYE